MVDPRAYRLLPSADRPTLILKAFGTSLFLWIYLATAIKRLHDRDRSGWWIVPFFVVPGLFSQFSDLLPDSNWVLAIVLVMQISWLWGFVEMFCLHGSLGRPTGSVPIRWLKPRTTPRPRRPHKKAGTSRASSKLSRPALARRRYGMLSGAHE